MFTSLTIASFMLAFAWLQQQFLNRLIESDLETLRKQHSKSVKRHADSQTTHSDSPLTR